MSTKVCDLSKVIDSPEFAKLYLSDKEFRDATMELVSYCEDNFDESLGEDNCYERILCDFGEFRLFCALPKSCQEVPKKFFEMCWVNNLDKRA